MLSLKEMLTIYKEDLKAPSISNGGWALDIFSPTSFLLTPGCNIKVPAGFGLKLPQGIGGIILSLTYSVKSFSDLPLCLSIN